MITNQNMKALLIIIILFAISGCSIRYVAPDGREASAKEKAECEYEAAKATASAIAANPFASAYGGLHAFSTNPAFREREILSLCMKLKGYAPSI